jgi:hydrogenase maturation factor
MKEEGNFVSVTFEVFFSHSASKFRVVHTQSHEISKIKNVSLLHSTDSIVMQALQQLHANIQPVHVSVSTGLQPVH